MSLQSEQKLSLYVDHQLCSPYAMFAFIALQEKKLPFAPFEGSSALDKTAIISIKADK